VLPSPRLQTPAKYSHAFLVIFMSALLLTGCGAVGSSPTTTPEANPVPTVSSVSPSTIIAGAMASTLTINGGGFIQSSTVQWNQSNRTTTFVSSTQLQVALTVADLALGETAQIVIVNPAPGGGASSAVTFTINNPAPQISGISPSTVSTIDGGSTVTVTGTGFVSNSSVTWNTAARTTTYVSATQLQFKLLANDLATVGTEQISVSNPAPGGGTATPSPIVIMYPVPVIISLTPGAVAAGGPQFTLTVHGSGFSPTSVVQFNGVPRTTTYVNSSTLTTVISSTDIATPAMVQVTVFTGQPGGGTSAPPATLTISTFPVPTITSVSPNSISINSPDTLVSIFGSGFTFFSTVQVNGGSALNNNGGYDTQLLFTLPAADLTSVGPLSITVSNPGTSPSNTVMINVTPNPVPTLSMISPNSAAVGGADFTLTAFGSNFVPTSVLQWNGTARPTVFGSASQLTASISATDIQSLGNNAVSVSNPAPGGGFSTASMFTTYIPLLTNDLIYDSHNGLLYASVPSNGGPSLGNSIVSIDPYTGNIGTPIFVGSEPGKMSLSADGTTIWVAFRGTPSARKVDLTSGIATSVQPYFPGGWGSNVYATMT
jgi:hypothetical protein